MQTTINTTTDRRRLWDQIRSDIYPVRSDQIRSDRIARQDNVISGTRYRISWDGLRPEKKTDNRPDPSRYAGAYPQIRHAGADVRLSNFADAFDQIRGKLLEATVKITVMVKVKLKVTITVTVTVTATETETVTGTLNGTSRVSSWPLIPNYDWRTLCRIRNIGTITRTLNNGWLGKYDWLRGTVRAM